MKISNKIIIIAILVLIIILSIFLSKDFIIRQYFIQKVSNVNFDKYILEYTLNSQKSQIMYYQPNLLQIISYNTEQNILAEYIEVYDYTNNIYYEKDLNTSTISSQRDLTIADQFSHLNSNLLDLLTNKNDNRKFHYAGTSNINNRECYILEFVAKTGNEAIYSTIFLDKEQLYVVKEIHYFPTADENQKYLTMEYELDLELNKKNLFK